MTRKPRTMMMITMLTALLPVLARAEAPSASGDPASCQTVRLSDVGWADVTSTTALFSSLLERLGYRPTITVLSVPVTYASMKNRDIDVFLGNWMPAQNND